MDNSEREYNDATNRMDQYVDKGIVPAKAWELVDPDGKIRKAEEERQQKLDRLKHHVGAQVTQQVGIDHELARIEAIPDPAKREKEHMYYQAKQIAKRHINGRTYDK
jgi:protein-tyrosine-phosphatase